MCDECQLIGKGPGVVCTRTCTSAARHGKPLREVANLVSLPWLGMLAKKSKAA
jgi:hypothetical protein